MLAKNIIYFFQAAEHFFSDYFLLQTLLSFAYLLHTCTHLLPVNYLLFLCNIR